ncbi:Transcriptional activator Myb [Fusarium oxysporum f. sp. rapae]|uniref:Transcriptional activator Myb n=2 Tax=Fusarium oxysporum TaxID=5507 RepID=A0A8J5NM38_FUSOX|nr:Transcriptional activator Myb [Fusarium oxysporum f. sp. rapae]
MATATRTPRKWTREEDRTLIYEAELQLSRRMTIDNWKSIAAKIPGRTRKDCCKRWSKVCRNNNKGAWDKAEDARLQNAVGVYGLKYSVFSPRFQFEADNLRWPQVAAEVRTRYADQCAKRWYHSLDPSVDRSVWREDEDQKLLAAMKMYGQQWKVISDNVFPRRSTTDIKNRSMHFSRKRTLRARDVSLNQMSSSHLSRTQSPSHGLNFDSIASSDDASHSPYLLGLPTPPSESASDWPIDPFHSPYLLGLPTPPSESASDWPIDPFHSPYLLGLPTPPSESASDWPIDPSSTCLPCNPVLASTQEPSLRANNGCLTSELFAGLSVAQIDPWIELSIWPSSTDSSFLCSDLDLPVAAATTAAFPDTPFYASLLPEHEKQKLGFNELNIDPSLQEMSYQQQQQQRMNMTLALEGVDQTTLDNVVEYLIRRKTSFAMQAI